MEHEESVLGEHEAMRTCRRCTHRKFTKNDQLITIGSIFLECVVGGGSVAWVHVVPPGRVNRILVGFYVVGQESEYSMDGGVSGTRSWDAEEAEAPHGARSLGAPLLVGCNFRLGWIGCALVSGGVRRPILDVCNVEMPHYGACTRTPHRITGCLLRLRNFFYPPRLLSRVAIALIGRSQLQTTPLYTLNTLVPSPSSAPAHLGVFSPP